MGEHAKALGVGSSIEFRGKTYTVPPWNFGIMGKYESYLEDYALQRARQAARRMSNDESRDYLRAVSQDIATGAYSFGGSLVKESLNKPQHFKYLLWLLLQENHPEVRLELVSEMVDEKMAEIIDKMAEANADPNQQTPATPTSQPE
jgi:hypothetical protein